MKNGKLLCDGREVLNLCSNNYLGISDDLDPLSVANASEMVGATASRLIVGNHPSFGKLEQTIAELKGAEAALVFSTGYMANIGVIPAISGSGDIVYSDRLNHASIIDGIRLSGAKLVRYRHNNPDDLKRLLEKETSYRRKLIVTESLFSMDGDIAPLERIVDLKNTYGATLMVDEAHSSGVYGEYGAGLVNELQLVDDVEVQMGTFSKAYGCFGAYVAGDQRLIDYLVNKARSFIYTTGLPPIINALNTQAVEIAKKDNWRRIQLHENALFFRGQLRKSNLDVGQSQSQIVPLMVGDDEKSMVISQRLFDNGIAAVAIRPPTVPKNSSRLRFSLMATHDRSDLERAVEIIAETVGDV